ncbi:MAG: hypothetical protein HYY16_19855 [Planctomycetes bacterium]|nr:hypothetical protein [Planctomycetota bacterium]
MSYFSSTDDLYACIGGLFDWAKKDPQLGPSLRQSNLTIRMVYTEPDAMITIDCAHDPKEKGAFVSWSKGDGGLTAEVEFHMKADVAHRFWLGKVNLLIALTKREITAKGSIPKALKILPKLKPMYAQYPKILEKLGRTELGKA